mmetsp:Transcript_72848/g.142583  ORF Transcript_72848/g.142583 Transcript_72848/m.142583 type:complete len:271 (-) Transcript_72848:883-1695(-)
MARMESEGIMLSPLLTSTAEGTWRKSSKKRIDRLKSKCLRSVKETWGSSRKRTLKGDHSPAGPRLKTKHSTIFDSWQLMAAGSTRTIPLTRCGLSLRVTDAYKEPYECATNKAPLLAPLVAPAPLVAQAPLVCKLAEVGDEAVVVAAAAAVEEVSRPAYPCAARMPSMSVAIWSGFGGSEWPGNQLLIAMEMWGICTTKMGRIGSSFSTSSRSMSYISVPVPTPGKKIMGTAEAEAAAELCFAAAPFSLSLVAGCGGLYQYTSSPDACLE